MSYRVEVRLGFGGATGGWRPAITGTLNQTGKSDRTASNFQTESDAVEAANMVIGDSASADDVRIIEDDGDGLDARGSGLIDEPSLT